ncbi:MAG: DUF6524 family protein [Gammaproteobacteria bacterium]|jgi:hypothetical protein|nr:DUF6524 family protein [Gammaproteobacteria bacterium]
MAAKEFTWSGFVVRLIFALFLVFATYNPSGYSYFHWVERTLPSFDPLMAITGVCLLIGWVIFLRATLRSLGPLGVILTSALFGAILWLVVDKGWIAPDSFTAISYIVLVLLSTILATGMSWSHIRRRMTGQFDVDEVEED